MLIEVKKSVEQTEHVEINAPCYYYDKNGIAAHYINSDGILLSVFPSHIFYYSPGDLFYDRNILDAIKGTEITRRAFMDMWEKVSEKLLAIVDHVTA